MVTVDKGWLAAVLDLASEAAGAVARLNERMGGIVLERRCSKARLETGTMPAGCPAE